MRKEAEETKRRFAENEKILKQSMEVAKENEIKTRDEVKISHKNFLIK